MTRAAQTIVMILLLCQSLRADIVAESRVHDDKYAIRVTDKAIQDSPKWTADLENPPLSARRAVELATAMQKQVIQDTDDYEWKFESLKLERYKGDYWYWEVLYEAKPRGPRTGRSPYFRLVVLMDGLVVRPTVMKYKD